MDMKNFAIKYERFFHSTLRELFLHTYQWLKENEKNIRVMNIVIEESDVQGTTFYSTNIYYINKKEMH